MQVAFIFISVYFAPVFFFEGYDEACAQLNSRCSERTILSDGNNQALNFLVYFVDFFGQTFHFFFFEFINLNNIYKNTHRPKILCPDCSAYLLRNFELIKQTVWILFSTIWNETLCSFSIFFFLFQIFIECNIGDQPLTNFVDTHNMFIILR